MPYKYNPFTGRLDYHNDPFISDIYGSTTSNMEIYVSPSGSDEIGDGSEGSPYATLNKAHSVIPHEIAPDHIVHIHLAAGTYDQPDIINFDVQGYLHYDGSAAMADYDAGPYTIASGGFSIVVAYFVGEIIVSGGGLTPNDFQGKFIQFLTGSRAGMITGILSNTATMIRIANWGLATPTDGDTFKIVEPGAEIAISSSLDVYGGRTLSPYGFFGIKFTGGDSKTFRVGGNKPTVRHMGSIFDVKVHGQGGQLLGYANGIPAGSVDATGWLVDWEGCGIVTQKITAERFLLYYTSIIGAPSVYAVAKESLYMEGCHVVDPVNNEGIYVGSASKFAMGGMYFDCAGKRCITSDDAACLSISVTYVEAALIAFSIGPANQVTFGNVDGNSSNVTYVMNIYAGSAVTRETSMGLTGTTADVRFNTNAATHSYPASGNWVTDSVGAFLVTQ
jgi:hypothetical protein